MKVGDQIPDTKLQQMTSDGPIDVTLQEYSKGRKVALFGVPAAYSPTCSESHLPGFIDKAQAIKSAGVDAIACLSTSDFFVMDAWAKSLNVGTAIDMLSDGNGEFIKASDLSVDFSGVGLGERMKRFSAVVEDGKITQLTIEEDPTQDGATNAEALLSNL